MSDAPHEPSVPPLTDAKRSRWNMSSSQGGSGCADSGIVNPGISCGHRDFFEHSMTEEEAACFDLKWRRSSCLSRQRKHAPSTTCEIGRPKRRTMPALLQSAEFSPADLQLVAGFECGSHRGRPPCRSGSRRRRRHDLETPNTTHPFGCTFTTRSIVGFDVGVNPLDRSVPRWPLRTSIIPALAIQTDFQHLPRHHDEEEHPTFSHQIVGDLLGKALLQAPDFVVLWFIETITRQ